MADILEIEKTEAPPRDQLISFKEYAENNGITYETVRRTMAAHQDEPEFIGHIFTIERTRYFDEEGAHALDRIRSSKQVAPVVIHEKSQDYKKMEEQLAEKDRKIEELRNEITRHRDDKEALLKKLNDIKNDPSLALDTSKYMLIEDHKKVEEELKQKDEKIKELSSTVESQAEDLDALRDVTLKNVELSRKNDETLREIEKKREELREASLKTDEIKRQLSDTEIERDKAKLENDKLIADAEIQKKKADQELEEALKLGFFARRRKLKELMKKKNEEQ